MQYQVNPTELTKENQHAEPGYYEVNFTNGISTQLSVLHNYGIHKYHFPEKDNGLVIDLSYALSGRFVAEEHNVSEDAISGWIDTKTTCSRGIYRIYYYLEVPGCKSIALNGDHKFLVEGNNTADLQVNIGFSSVNVEYAKERIQNNSRFHTECSHIGLLVVNSLQLSKCSTEVGQAALLLFLGIYGIFPRNRT